MLQRLAGDQCRDGGKPTGGVLPAVSGGSGTASLLILAAALALAGCQSLPRPERKPLVPTEPERLGTLADQFDDAEFMLVAGNAANAFTLRPQGSSDPLPAGNFATVSVTEGGLLDALQLLVAGSSIGLIVEGGPRSLERYGPAAALSVSGNFPELLEKLSQSLGFFYSLQGGMLRISPEERFLLDLPPALGEDNLAGLSNTLQHLGAQDLYLDRLNRTATFRTNRSGARAIEKYLAHIRSTRSMLLYDVHVYQVDLADGQDTGVQWNQLGWTGSTRLSGGTGTGTTGGTASSTGDISAPFGSDNRAITFGSGGVGNYGIGAVIAGPRFNMNVLVDFLRTQGNVRAISQPRIALMSGSRGSLRVGQTTSYVAKVGTNVSTNLNQVTVETQNVLTGFELTLFAEEHEGSIYTQINLNLADLIKFNSFKALGTDLTLPQTAERDVRTMVRARPGDIVLLGGIATQRDVLDVNNGLSAVRSTGSVQRSELVIALRPRVVRFGERVADTQRHVDAATAAQVAAAAPAPAAAPLPAPVTSPVPARVTAPVAVAPSAQAAVEPAADEPAAARPLPPPPVPSPSAGASSLPARLVGPSGSNDLNENLAARLVTPAGRPLPDRPAAAIRVPDRGLPATVPQGLPAPIVRPVAPQQPVERLVLPPAAPIVGGPAR